MYKLKLKTPNDHPQGKANHKLKRILFIAFVDYFQKRGINFDFSPI